jgi:hypothetical protein
LLAATTSVACSERALTPERAASLITALEQFKHDAHFTIHTGIPLQSAFKCQSQAEVDRTPLNQFVVERGWVRYETRDAILGFGTKSSCPAIALTPAGEAASAQWMRGRGASGEGTAWAVPIGRRELLGVTGLTTAPMDSRKWSSTGSGRRTKRGRHCESRFATPMSSSIKRERAALRAVNRTMAGGVSWACG